ncbi:hypothetical protein Tco_0089810 [Tanacetum coccineum]
MRNLQRALAKQKLNLLKELVNGSSLSLLISYYKLLSIPGLHSFNHWKINLGRWITTRIASVAIRDCDRLVLLLFEKTQDSCTAGEVVTTAGDDSVVPTTNEEITLAQTLIQIKAAKPKLVTTVDTTTTTTTRPKDKGVVVQEPSEFRVPQEIKPLSSKDKGKGIMNEPEVPLKRKDQIALDEQIVRDIQAKLDAELLESQKLQETKKNKANIALEREELTDEEKAKLFMELMEKRRKHFFALKAQEKRNRPHTKAQKRTQMSTYLKHMVYGSEVQENKEKKEEGREETAKGSRKKMLGRKRAVKEQQEESSKKQKVEEEKESKEVEEDDEVELKNILVVKKDDDIAIDAIPLATKLPMIIKYKLHKEGILLKKKLEDSEETIKFRGGLLGLKRLHGFLEVTTAQCWWWKDYDCLKTFYCQEDKDALKR